MKGTWTMKRWLINAVLIVIGGGILAGCAMFQPQQDASPLQSPPPPADVCIDQGTGNQMTREEAIQIAEASNCVAEGPLLETVQCNSLTGTWWLDLDIEREGCMPACVVDINDKTAEINWRCTGLKVSETSTPTEPAPTATPESVPPFTKPVDDTWAKYANTEYDFAFRYPPDWFIELLTDRPAEVEGQQPARAVRLTRGTTEILVAFKRPNEDVVIGPGNLGAGTVEERGRIELLGREVPRQVLVHEGKDKAVFLGDQFPDLTLYIQMVDNTGDDYAAAEITAEAYATFAEILSTFTRTTTTVSFGVYPGWENFTSAPVVPDYRFSFRYPASWHLEERPAGIETGSGPAAPMIVLSKESYVLQIQYKPVGEQLVMTTGNTQDSLLMEAGTAWFMSQPVPRFVVVKDDALQRVLLTYNDDVIMMSVELKQDATKTDTPEAEIPTVIRGEMDQILASFKVDKE